jgi:hypothetical protein
MAERESGTRSERVQNIVDRRRRRAILGLNTFNGGIYEPAGVTGVRRDRHLPPQGGRTTREAATAHRRGRLGVFLAWPGVIPDRFRDRGRPQPIDAARFLAGRGRATRTGAEPSRGSRMGAAAWIFPPALCSGGSGGAVRNQGTRVDVVLGCGGGTVAVPGCLPPRVSRAVLPGDSMS